MLRGISHFCVAHPFIASAIQTLGAALIARRVRGPGDDRRWLSTAEARSCGGMGMTLNIPDSVLQCPRIPEGEIAQRLRSELAIALYAQGALSLGKAAELAEVNRMLFGEMVGQRGIARHYGDAELAQDVSYARSE